MGHKRVNWKKYSKRLGKISDYKLAKLLGVSREAVRQQREQRGIPPKFNRDTRPKGINWDKQPLGEIPDAELAEELEVSYSTVSRARRIRGIRRYKDR